MLLMPQLIKYIYKWMLKHAHKNTINIENIRIINIELTNDVI